MLVASGRRSMRAPIRRPSALPLLQPTKVAEDYLPVHWPACVADVAARGAAERALHKSGILVVGRRSFVVYAGLAWLSIMQALPRRRRALAACFGRHGCRGPPIHPEGGGLVG